MLDKILVKFYKLLCTSFFFRPRRGERRHCPEDFDGDISAILSLRFFLFYFSRLLLNRMRKKRKRTVKRKSQKHKTAQTQPSPSAQTQLDSVRGLRLCIRRRSRPACLSCLAPCIAASLAGWLTEFPHPMWKSTSRAPAQRVAEAWSNGPKISPSKRAMIEFFENILQSVTKNEEVFRKACSCCLQNMFFK